MLHIGTVIVPQIQSHGPISNSGMTQMVGLDDLRGLFQLMIL